MPLRAPTAAVERDRLHRAAQALEALVLKQVVTASHAFTGGEGAGSAVRAGMFADALADAIVKGGGIGLTAQIERSLSGEAAAPSPSARELPPRAAWPAATPGARPASAAAGAPEDADDLAGASGLGPIVAPGVAAAVTSAFGPRRDPFTGRGADHHGLDLAEPEGAPIRAALDGVVRSAGPRGGYGNAIEIDHGNGLTTVYAHAAELLVRDGERVTQGQDIARVGHTGRSTGPHLHFEVRQGGTPVDPARALKIYGARADETDSSGS